MTPLEQLTEWWGVVGGGPLPTAEEAIERVRLGGIDPGTGALIYVIRREVEAAEATP